MNIPIGATLSLILEQEKGFIAAYFVGEKKGHHVVLTFPEEKSSYAEKIKGRDAVGVQYSENGVRYEFRSRVIKFLDEPVDLVVLEYPAKIYSIDKRALSRISCLILAKLKNKMDNDAQQASGIIENISKTGCRCKITDSVIPFSAGDQVILKCRFPGLMGEQTTEGKVVRIQKEEKGSIIGIHFDEKVWWVPPYDRK